VKGALSLRSKYIASLLLSPLRLWRVIIGKSTSQLSCFISENLLLDAGKGGT
jgi:hypothetical protein